ncbi:MAG: hypothetical protein D5S00_02790 [Tindallia sp. MSAO_Bac2]|nr:MAG: hypothetical protein D5S00_02790 [Tindallia sp. MSAO_Bac2]
MKRKASKIEIRGNQLICPVCEREEFWERETLMNTAGATFLGFDWANKPAQNYVCDYCGYVYWFIK